jgi:hypothetical protein
MLTELPFLSITNATMGNEIHWKKFSVNLSSPKPKPYAWVASVSALHHFHMYGDFTVRLYVSDLGWQAFEKCRTRSHSPNVTLFIPRVFLRSLAQPTHALNKILSWTTLNPLHVSATRFHHQGANQYNRIKFEHANLVDIRLPPRCWSELRSWCGIRQRGVVIIYRRFGTTYRSHLHGSRSPRSVAVLFLNFLTFEDGTDTLSRNICKGLTLHAELYP